MKKLLYILIMVMATGVVAGLWHGVPVGNMIAVRGSNKGGGSAGNFPFDWSVGIWDFANSNIVQADTSFIGTNTVTLGAGSARPTFIDAIAPTSSWYSFDGTDVMNGGGNWPALTMTNTAGDIPFSVSLWLKPASGFSGFGTPISKHRLDIAQTRAWMLYVSNLDKCGVILSDKDGSNDIDIQTVTAIDEGVWTHFVMTYDGSATSNGVTFYTNGVAIGSENRGSSGTYTGMTSDGSIMNIGRLPGAQNPYSGGIDDPRIYTNELTAAQALTLYNEGSASHP